MTLEWYYFNIIGRYFDMATQYLLKIIVMNIIFSVLALES